MSSDSVFSEQQDDTKITEEGYDQSDRERAMEVYHNYISNANNWEGILPYQWSNLNQEICDSHIPQCYFASQEGGFSRLAIVYNEEMEQLSQRKQREGQRIMLSLLQLGSKIKAVIEQGNTQCLEAQSVEEKTKKYFSFMGKAERMVRNVLEALKAWLTSVLGMNKKSLKQPENKKEELKNVISSFFKGTNSCLGIYRPLRTLGIMGLTDLGPDWIAQTLKDSHTNMVHQLGRDHDQGKLGYVVSPYGNVVSMSYLSLSGAYNYESGAIFVCIVDFLGSQCSDDDILNSLKLGLFVSAALRN